MLLYKLGPAPDDPRGSNLPGFYWPLATDNWPLLLNRLTLRLGQLGLFVRHRLLVRSGTQHLFHADIFAGVDPAFLDMDLAGRTLSRLRRIRRRLHVGNLLVGHQLRAL